jgi:hypothetical protein
MPIFNGVYLHNYKVLDYGLIYNINPKWGQVLVASGPDAHLIRRTGCFLVIQK